jgi:C1A family cysteine protease
MKSLYTYGWKPDLPDHRDYFYAAAPEVLSALPASVDLRAQCPAPYNQLNLGSCTSNAIAGALEFDQIKQRLPESTPSRLFIYYNERVMEHSVLSDSGAMIRDGVKSVNKQGACAETLWPYDVSQFAVQPPPTCYQAAAQHRALRYQRIPRTLAQMKACLAAGLPFLYGFTVYESFESMEVANTGVVPMPRLGEAVWGGHAVLAVGYSDEKQWFITRNSWGANWGDHGYFYMPYLYLMDPGLSSDFWVIQTVE